MDPIEAIREAIHRCSLVIAREARAENDGKRVITFRAMTEGVASDGGIVRAAGADFSRFDKNPTVLWGHGWTMEHDIPTIGRVIAKRFDQAGRAWDFDVEFPPEGVHELADKVFRMAQLDFLVAGSIGFRILEFERNLTDDEKTALGLPGWGWVAKRWELNEFSIVPIGADPDAVKHALDEGLVRSADLSALVRPGRERKPAAPAPAPTPAADPDHLAAIRENTAAVRELAELLRADPPAAPTTTIPEDEARGEEPTTVLPSGLEDVLRELKDTLGDALAGLTKE